jgi:hypothetical protein
MPRAGFGVRCCSGTIALLQVRAAERVLRKEREEGRKRRREGALSPSFPPPSSPAALRRLSLSLPGPPLRSTGPRPPGPGLPGQRDDGPSESRVVASSARAPAAPSSFPPSTSTAHTQPPPHQKTTKKNRSAPPSPSAPSPPSASPT